MTWTELLIPGQTRKARDVYWRERTFRLIAKLADPLQVSFL